MTVVVNDRSHKTEAGRSFYAAVDETIRDGARVAFDCEGVKLGRAGSIELVSICFECIGSVFLVDVSKMVGTVHLSSRIAALKRLFECELVEKVIHDCRMDADALFHHHDIRIVNVHDTSSYHSVLTGSLDRKNLNDVLANNGVATNDHRDTSIYKWNPEFWATRPLTKRMIKWAASDVDKLLTLGQKQKKKKASSGMQKKASTKSQNNRMMARKDVVCKVSCGLFIGTRGVNIINLQERTGTMIRNGKRNDSFIVYYNDPASLNTVLRSMGHDVADAKQRSSSKRKRAAETCAKGDSFKKQIRR